MLHWRLNTLSPCLFILLIFEGISPELAAQDNRSKLHLDTLNQSIIIQNPTDQTTDLGVEWMTISTSDFGKSFGKKQHLPGIKPGKALISDSLIVVHSQEKDVRFPITSTIYYGYIGHLEFLDIHVLNCSSASAGIAYKIIVDGKTGYQFPIGSPFDNGSVGPVVSPDKNLLLFYDNDVFEPNRSMLQIQRIERTGELFILKPILQQIMNFEIEEITWVDDHRIALFTVTVEPSDEKESSDATRKTYDYQMCVWNKTKD